MKISRLVLPSALALTATLGASVAAAQEPNACLSTNPADWPAPSKPYFMIAFDTSGSMDSTVSGAANSCGYENTRLGHGRCAVRNTVRAFSQANFGLASFARELVNCNPTAPGTCATGTTTTGGLGVGCAVQDLPNNSGGTSCSAGCGNEAAGGTNSSNRRGANILEPMQQDNYWAATPAPTNVPSLLEWVDNNCTAQGLPGTLRKELFASGCTPLNGIIRDMQRYFQTGWCHPSNISGSNCTTITYPSPLGDAPNERPCRSVNVILITDGGETCDSGADAVDAARDLYTGFTKGGINWNIRTFVIDFGGGAGATGSQMADAGDDGISNNSAAAVVANNEAQLSSALANIISSQLRPEICNNLDDNCNGCSDEGYRKYCNRNKTPAALNLPSSPVAGQCCQWTTTAQRNACLAAHAPTVSASKPNGDQFLLPCWDPGSSPSAPQTKWLCTNPGENCDNLDNNCDSTCLGSPPSVSCGFQNLATPPNTADEGFNKCPNCPVPEVCDGIDQNCDAIIDNAAGSGIPYSACPNNCQSSPEICDGCDNDCDGVADDGIPPIACGFPNPPNCSGQSSCVPIPGVGIGGCDPGGNSFGPCVNSPQPEVCDNLDNDCDGVLNNGVPPTACDVPGQPGLVYGGTSQCRRGLMPCNGSCQGWVGPSTEVCDGIDNDCDGSVDESVPGVGLSCGTDTGACSRGNTACVGGVIVCQGGTGPGPEVCNGVDDDCDGSTDEPTLGDAPAQPGCWTNAGSACSHGNAQWSPPAGATCTGLGTLTTPCRTGNLQCQGTSGWVCVGPVGPAAEVCDGADNDCDGSTDEGVPPPGTTCGSNVGVCQFGTQVCTGGVLQCQGGVLPSAEVCDGDDDDCDGVVDGTVAPGAPISCTTNANCTGGRLCLVRSSPADRVCAFPPPGTGVTCGSSQGECRTGTTACVGGAIVCQGEVLPQPEICDNRDNDCDGAVDDGPLTDAPASLGCWQLPGNCCSGGGRQWCPPAGATCTGAGTLTAPCGAGSLVCTGAGGWQCQGGTTPGTEVCDGLDNDCDGAVDEGNPGGGGTCGSSNVGRCKFGTLTCTGGAITCVGEVGPAPEICNGVDDDCDGQTDETVPGSGNACGLSTGQCRKGTTACVGGVLVCQGGVPPAPETCNGLDDDCDGITDDSPQDAPTDPNCWTVPGTMCTYSNAQWDPPPGGTCTGLGTLTLPCATGKLACAGLNGWACIGGKGPGGEVCDGIDNDCNGTVDDGNPGGGDVCGSDVGECDTGLTVCVGGNIDCQGEKGPAPEACNGLDDDCDGQTDNGIPIGGTCAAPYDTAAYPGDRTQGECRPGQQQCDGNGGLVCIGGTGPQAEVCDGRDNDCDGQTDEAGPQPDGIDGTVDPLDSTRKIGDPCGTDEGECKQGRLACTAGKVTCLGAVGPQPEQCDCADNDCDGQIDEQPTGMEPALCSPGKSCVAAGEGCQCAEPCKTGEFPCPTGTDCQKGLPISGGSETGDFCVDRDPCGNCATQTRFDGQGVVTCAPAGTVIGGKTVPTCVCKGQFGCQSPCFNITCPGGQACVPTGPATGTCQPSTNCNFFGCAADKACNGGVCVDNPCALSNPCTPDQVCKPSSGFDSAECSGSCAAVDCDVGQKCQGGTCVDTGCGVDCGAGEHCLPGDGGFACGPSRCMDTGGGLECSNGAYCDPLTGTCGNDPCSGVLCPSGQVCAAGECVASSQPGSDAGVDGGSAGTSAAGGTGGGPTVDAGSDSSAGTAGTGATTKKQDRRVFGLATGGGGCACRTTPSHGPASALFGALGLGLALLWRRQRRVRAEEVAR